MITLFVEAWDANKERLREYFKTHEMEVYSIYKQLVRVLFDCVINPYLEEVKGIIPYDARDEEITVIDNGDYQGTQLFALHKETYQPSAWEYVLTHQYYGSCSGCDTLMGITENLEDKLPGDEQVEMFMTLCLHLLQRCTIPYESYCDED